MKGVLVVALAFTVGTAALTVYLFLFANGGSRKASPVSPQEPAAAALALNSAPVVERRDYRAHEEAAAPAQDDDKQPASSALPPHQDLTPREESDRNIAAIKAKGSDGTKWFPLVHEATREWSALAKEVGIDVRIGSWDCFTGGCTSSWTFANPADVDSMMEKMMPTKSFMDWPGAKFRSGPMESNGSTNVTWVLFVEEEPSNKPPM